jgi:hypothetical protein
MRLSGGFTNVTQVSGKLEVGFDRDCYTASNPPLLHSGNDRRPDYLLSFVCRHIDGCAHSFPFGPRQSADRSLDRAGCSSGATLGRLRGRRYDREASLGSRRATSVSQGTSEGEGLKQYAQMPASTRRVREEIGNFIGTTRETVTRTPARSRGATWRSVTRGSSQAITFQRCFASVQGFLLTARRTCLLGGSIFSIIEKSNEKAVQERIKRLSAYPASLQEK